MITYKEFEVIRTMLKAGRPLRSVRITVIVIVAQTGITVPLEDPVQPVTDLVPHLLQIRVLTVERRLEPPVPAQHHRFIGPVLRHQIPSDSLRLLIGVHDRIAELTEPRQLCGFHMERLQRRISRLPCPSHRRAENFIHLPAGRAFRQRLRFLLPQFRQGIRGIVRFRVPDKNKPHSFPLSF